MALIYLLHGSLLYCFLHCLKKFYYDQSEFFFDFYIGLTPNSPAILIGSLMPYLL